MIVKSKDFKSFTVLDNSVIREEKLSLKAKGLFSILCSLPADWKIIQTQLQEFSSDGGSATINAFQELIDYGLIKVVKKNDRYGKNFRGNFSYVVYPNLETANNHNESEFNLNEIEDAETVKMPDTNMENTFIENPYMENRVLLNKDILNTDIQNKDKVNNYKLFIDSYFQFFKNLNGFPPKLNAAEGKAMKKIIEYLETVSGSNEKSFESWQYILKNWKSLSEFNQKRMRLIDINSNLVNLLIEFRNNKKQTSGKINSAYNQTMQNLLNQKQNG